MARYNADGYSPQWMELTSEPTDARRAFPCWVYKHMAMLTIGRTRCKGDVRSGNHCRQSIDRVEQHGCQHGKGERWKEGHFIQSNSQNVHLCIPLIDFTDNSSFASLWEISDILKPRPQPAYQFVSTLPPEWKRMENSHLTSLLKPSTSSARNLVLLIPFQKWTWSLFPISQLVQWR
jgi:hypothetical protein